MGSGFDNSIYWIISHVVTTIRYYTFTQQSTTELPWTTSSWRILSNSLHCFLYRLGTDHIENISPTELPWTTSSWRILSNNLHCFLHRLGTDHIENTSTTELPWTTSSWRILSHSLDCFLYRLGTDHIENTTTELPWTTSSRRILSNRAEQSRRLLPAISRHGHSWHRAPVGPVAIYLLDVKTFVFFFFLRWSSSMIKRRGLHFFFSSRCFLTTP
jgi:uncharacterized membrane protein YccF (DUF307 family)